MGNSLSSIVAMKLCCRVGEVLELGAEVEVDVQLALIRDDWGLADLGDLPHAHV